MPSSLASEADSTRKRTNAVLDEFNRSVLGQFMTPAVVAEFMASMFEKLGPDVRLLDAGAGVGSLTAAVIDEVLKRSPTALSIESTAYEVDPTMVAGLKSVLRQCEAAASHANVRFIGRVFESDFIVSGCSLLQSGLFEEKSAQRFNAAILNPPYRKISSKSSERRQLSAVGIETSNLYAAFVALAIRLLEPDGELVAITPRSFCNGPYFRPFRRLLLGEAALLRVHGFESRKDAFRDDAVLQENLVFHIKKGKRQGRVVLSMSPAPGKPVSERTVPGTSVVDPNDPNAFIHLAMTEEDSRVAERMATLPCRLSDLGITVSTGRVVDFRARKMLRNDPGPGTVPLIYPTHFKNGFVVWPKAKTRKANALAPDGTSATLLVPNETYVLTKRFTSKEERRRVVAVVCEPHRFPGATLLGIENHVNYFHASGNGLPSLVAKGLAAYLNSTLVDRYFRQFNGHTQVNATDLRSIKYPDLDTLKSMGKRITSDFPDQARLDALFRKAVGDGLVERDAVRG